MIGNPLAALGCLLGGCYIVRVVGYLVLQKTSRGHVTTWDACLVIVELHVLEEATSVSFHLSKVQSVAK